MGGSGGGTSGQPSTSTPQVFLPQNQPGANQNWLNIAQGLYGGALPAATSGINPAYQYYPQAQTAAGNLFANPYANQALQGGLEGSQLGANLFASPTGPYQLGGALGNEIYSLLTNLTGAATNPLYASLVQQAQANPYAAQALQGAQTGAGIGAGAVAGVPGQIAQLQGLGGQEAGLAGPLSQQALGLAGPLASQEASIQQLSQDPQSALYQRTLSQLQDQINASLGASGVGASPYGQSVLGNALSNFGIDWQNQQLQRQIAGGQAMQGLSGQQLADISGAGNIFNQLASGAGGLYGQALGLGAGGAGLAAGSAALPGQAYLSQLQSVLPFLQAQTQAAGQGATGVGQLTGAAQGAGGLQQQAINSYVNAMGLPYQTLTGQGQTGLGGLQNLANFGMGMYTLPQDVLNAYGGYGQFGQNAALRQAQLAQLDQPNFQGIGSLLGGVGNLFGGGAGGSGIGGLLGSTGGAPLSSFATAGAGPGSFLLPGTETALEGGFAGGAGGTIAGTAGGSGILGFLSNIFGALGPEAAIAAV